jgi:DNA-binding NarL/FixJ family response regulator
MQEDLSILIVTRSRRLQKALQALLSAVPQIGAIERADDIPLAMQIVSARPPALVVLNGDLWEGDIPVGLGEIRAQLPGASYVVLADTIKQQQAAEAAGADSALLKGTPAAELLAAIEMVLPRPYSDEVDII